MGELEHLSYSRLSTYASCGKKYDLLYNQKVERSPQGSFIGGICVHDTIEEAEHREWVFEAESFEEGGAATNYFHERLRHEVNGAGGIAAIRWGGRKSKAYPQGHDFDWWWTFGPGMLKRFHALRLRDEAEGFKIHPVHGVERQVNATLPSGTRLTTRLDALVMVSPDGEAGIRDYKTGQAWAGGKYQNTLYAWAVLETLGLPVAWGELVYLGAASEKAVRFPITDDAIAASMTWLAAAEDGIRKEVFVPNPGSFCASCPALAFCEVGLQTVEKEDGPDGTD